MIRSPRLGLAASVLALILTVGAFVADPALQPCYAVGLPMATMFVFYQTARAYAAAAGKEDNTHGETV